MLYRIQPPILDDDLPEDDVDRLFSQLRPVEPPQSLIAHVISQVTAYAPAPCPPPFAQITIMLHELDNWTMQQKKRSLC